MNVLHRRPAMHFCASISAARISSAEDSSSPVYARYALIRLLQVTGVIILMLSVAGVGRGAGVFRRLTERPGTESRESLTRPPTLNNDSTNSSRRTAGLLAAGTLTQPVQRAVAADPPTVRGPRREPPVIVVEYWAATSSPYGGLASWVGALAHARACSGSNSAPDSSVNACLRRREAAPNIVDSTWDSGVRGARSQSPYSVIAL